ncbi:MAG TPA: alkaline phosphatase family protein, partial [Candidatus Binatus sp.]|nr:alkaline phosphatase family protein [Candidatus Binatus sp.]
MALAAVAIGLAPWTAEPPAGSAATTVSTAPGVTTAPGSGAAPSVGGPVTGIPVAIASAALPVASGIPAFGHVFVLVMENKGFGAVIGNPVAPYINGLADRYGLATAYTAVSHPSEPNYLALWSGSTQGVVDDGIHDFASGATLGDQVLASGRSWHVAAENVPLGCFRGSSASGGEDGGGTYARKHEPAI